MESLIILALFVLFTWLFVWVSVSMAGKRGRSRVLWGVLSLVITPLLVWLILACLGDSYDVREEKRQDLLDAIKDLKR